MTYHKGTTRCPFCNGSGRLITPRPLTPRQAAVYAFLKDYKLLNGYAPSMKEIAQHFGLSGRLAAVHEHLSNLETKGWIRRRFRTQRAITLIADPEQRASA